MMVHLVTYMFTCAQMAQIQRLGVVFFLSFFFLHFYTTFVVSIVLYVSLVLS